MKLLSGSIDMDMGAQLVGKPFGTGNFAKGCTENCWVASPWLIAITLNGAVAGRPFVWTTAQSFITPKAEPIVWPGW
jgi:hypothetical protein